MPQKRRLIKPAPSVALKLASQTVMGMAMGLGFTLILSALDRHSVVRLLDHSGEHSTVFVFVGTIIATFAIGATLTGLIFVMTEES